MLGIKGAPELNLASVLTFSLEELPVTNSFTFQHILQKAVTYDQGQGAKSLRNAIGALACRKLPSIWSHCKSSPCQVVLHDHRTIGELTLAAKSSCFILSAKSLCERLS